MLKGAHPLENGSKLYAMYIYIESILIPVTVKKRDFHIGTPQKVHKATGYFGELVIGDLSDMVCVCILHLPDLLAPFRAFWCTPSCHFVCSSSCLLVYSFFVPFCVVQFVLFGVLLRAVLCAPVRAFWCTPSSCHFVWCSSCFLVYSLLPFCVLQFVLFGGLLRAVGLVDCYSFNFLKT